MGRRIPLEPVVDRIGNYYETVHVAAKRARYLYTIDSYTFGTDEKGNEHKKTVIALLEIAKGKIRSRKE